MAETVVSDLIINRLTKSQYDSITPSNTEIYVLTDELDAQYVDMPIAEAKYENQIVQYIGETTTDYVNGYFYKCVSDGETLATYSWQNVSVQDALPEQAGNETKFLTTDGTNASWSTSYVKKNGSYNQVNLSTVDAIKDKNSPAVAIGSSSVQSFGVGILGTASGTAGVAIGSSANASGIWSTAIGFCARAAGNYAIQLGIGTNSETNTLNVGFNSINYKLLNSDGTIPTERLTNVKVMTIKDWRE